MVGYGIGARAVGGPQFLLLKGFNMMLLISAMAVGVLFLTALLISFELRLISKELKRSNEISDQWWEDHNQYDTMGNKFAQQIDKVVQDLNGANK